MIAILVLIALIAAIIGGLEWFVLRSLSQWQRTLLRRDFYLLIAIWLALAWAAWRWVL